MMPTSSFFKVALLLWASSNWQTSVAQIHATCTNTSFLWSFNSLFQSPCEMGEALGGVCSPGSFAIPPLPEGYYYSGVNVAGVTPCVCNTVYYTMLSLCGLCQGGDADKFNLWSANCTQTSSSTFPSPLPSGLRVPHYAYLPLDPFNQTVDLRALQADTGAERTGTAGIRTPTTTSRRPTSTFGDDDPFGNFDNDVHDLEKRVGIIAGCVVAGVWVIWAIGAGLIWWICRRQSRRMYGPPSQLYQNNTGMSGYTAVAPSSPPPNGTFPPAPPSPGMLSEKVYDPNDPRTFPQAQPTLGYQQPHGLSTTLDRTSAVVSTASVPSTPTTYQPYQQPLVSPDRSSTLTPPGHGAALHNQYTVSPDGSTTLAPPPQGVMQNSYQSATMPVASYNTGGSYGSTANSLPAPHNPHRQAYVSGVPQI
ncbi:hypothetical protein L218DRAFT_989630 [Marasmius fiardii PR-910]|nr:hypothetical protein L218DRAFT_989630 [Marasmius fiardii PR-910]